MFDHAPDHDHQHGHHHFVGLDGRGEKRHVALVSVFAALLLTGTKIGVGLWTHSLGILAEALHSGLDLMAAIVTLYAVRMSSRPADKEHAYGHGKIENLSALFETLLLLGTCAWIVKEAIERLFLSAEVHVQANVWSFAVVLLSIAVDYSRSRALSRVAKKYDSQALEADALHFSTDIWSSLVVLLGLGGVVLARVLHVPWLAKADAVAALGVASVVIIVGVRLGRKSVNDLLDTMPADVAARVASLAHVDGVRDVRHVRVRRSGPELFVDLTLVLDRGESLQRSHEIACGAETAIRRELPSADVVVHVEPAEALGEDVLAVARRIAASHGAMAHNLIVYEDGAALVLELHLEIPGDLPLEQAHRRAVEIDEELRRTTPQLARVITHIEPAGGAAKPDSATAEETGPIRDALMRLPIFAERGISPDCIDIRRSGAEYSLSFRCLLPGDMTVKQTHDFTETVERTLRNVVSNVGRVTVRTEPLESCSEKV